MKNKDDLKKLLLSINRKSYPAYKETRGSYQFGDYIFNIDHVQGDPFAAPSKTSIQISGGKAGFPVNFYDLPHKRIALQDYLLRLFSGEIEKYNFKARGSGKSGLIAVSRPGQEILERSACRINPANGDVKIRLEIGFPANGRTIASTELIKILFDFLPECISKTLYYKALNPVKTASVIQLSEDQHYIRKELVRRGLTAFVANQSILPRESGISPLPMKGGAPFISPASMEITLELPHFGPIRGMGIKKGITLIVGGGYHGKSTLLKALELGVYNHISGDGREYVITDSSAVKIRAEDGRSIRNTDISLFINNLPNKKDTHRFTSEDASGSTSQAANVVEAMEAGTSLFLIDEDTCATNFMIRDELMQRVIQPEQEPITPFIDRVEALYRQFGISSILVAGSSGSFFHSADCIIQMDHYLPKDITALAKAQAAHFPVRKPAEQTVTQTLEQTEQPLKQMAEQTLKQPEFNRFPKAGREFSPNGRIKMKTLGKDAFSINRDTVDLRYLEQLVDSEQTAALSFLLKYAHFHCLDGKKTLQQVVAELMQLIEKKGLETLADGSYLSANLALPRAQEVFACFNRYRPQIFK